MLDAIKSLLRDQLGIDPKLILVVVGAVSFLALNVALNKRVFSPWGLLAPLILGIALEAVEIYVTYRSVGLFAPQNDPVGQIVLRHSVDIAILAVIPVLLCVVGAISSRP